MAAIESINALEMTVNENKIFTVDFTNFIHIREKIVGIVSAAFVPSTGSPAISEAAWSSDGKSVSFRCNAAAATPSTYELRLIVTTSKDGATQTVEARGDLVVNR